MPLPLLTGHAEERPAMMGIEERDFGPLPPVSLENFVPPDHVSWHLERTLPGAMEAPTATETERGDDGGAIAPG